MARCSFTAGRLAFELEGVSVPLGQHVSITSFNLHLAETRCCENRQKSLERGFVSFDTRVPRWRSTGVAAQIPDKSGCYLNAGLIHHTPLMGFRGRWNVKGLKAAIALNRSTRHYYCGCGWMESMTTQHNTTQQNTTQQRSNNNLERQHRVSLRLWARLTEIQLGH